MDKEQIDKKETVMYTQNQLEQVAQLAAQQAVQQLLQSNAHLDNSTSSELVGISKGEELMPKYKERIEVNGSLSWITANTKQELFEKAADVLRGNPAPVSKISPLFSEYEERWMNLYKKPKLRPTTYSTYKNLINKHILPYFGDKHLCDITVDTIQDFYNKKSYLAQSSCHQMSIILSQIFDYAVEDNQMTRNPTTSDRLSMSKKKTKRKALTLAQWKDITQNLKNITNHNDLTLLALLLFTGIRRGEALGLRWKNVHLDTKIININESITFGENNKGTDGDPKSESGIREVPIPDALLEILKQKGNPEHFVLGGETHYTQSKFDRAWERIGKTINLYGATPHILRHTYLTILGGTETDVKTIQTIAGHSDIRVTMGYIHKQDERINNAGIQVTKILLDQKCDNTNSSETKTT